MPGAMYQEALLIIGITIFTSLTARLLPIELKSNQERKIPPTLTAGIIGIRVYDLSLTNFLHSDDT